MSPIEFLGIAVAVAGIGVLWFGMRILRAIRQRSEPLKPVPPRPQTPFDKEVARAAEEFKQELAAAQAEAIAKARKRR